MHIKDPELVTKYKKISNERKKRIIILIQQLNQIYTLKNVCNVTP